MNAPLRLWLRLGPGEQALAAGAVAFLLARVAASLAPVGARDLLPFWPVSGLLLTALLLTPRRRWPAIGVGGLVGTFAHNLGTHGALLAGTFAVADVVLPLAGAAFVVRVAALPPDLCRLRDAMALIVGGAVMAPAVSGLIAAGVLAARGDMAFAEAWGTWTLTNAGGVLLFTPMLVSLAREQPSGPRARLWIGALALGTAVLSGPLLFGTDVPLAWVILVLPAAAALRYGVAAGSLAVLPWVVIALVATAQGRGIYAGSASSVREGVLYAQASTSMGTLVCVSLGALAAQLRRALHRLRRSEESVRLLVEGVRDHAMFMLDAGGRIASWNAGARRMLGFASDEVVGAPLGDLLCRAPGGGEELELDGEREQERWVRRADGSTFLGRFATHPVRGPDAQPGRRAVVLRDVTDARRAEQELRHLALHDSLTGLPNRNLLYDRLVMALAQARREGTAVGLLFLDVDRFKLVNDSLGHAAGDEVLRQVAGRLRALVRPGDTVARFGGDEFVVCCQDIGGERDAIRIAQRIDAELSHPIKLGEELFVGASVGIALAPRGTPTTADDLIRGADSAMYRAKENGGGYALVNDCDQARAIGRLRAETEVRHALERGELELHYQPIVDLASGLPVSVEALLRWNHPDRGRLAPGEFIPLAEETGAIGAIGVWVLEEACRAGHRLRELAGRPDLRVNVNVSARQLAQPGFVEAVGAVLGRTTTDPRSLCLELTETTLIEDLPRNAEVLGGLKRLGVSIAMDDFGIGYSSLGYLRRLPVDQLKLDRSFVTEVDDAAGGAPVLRAAVAMADALDVAVVAEGIERAEQRAALTELGYRFGQGFHFARPMTETATAEWLRGVQPGGTGRRLRVVGGGA